MNLKRLAMSVLDELFGETEVMDGSESEVRSMGWLTEHDEQYHHGHYQPGQRCKLREDLGINDRSDQLDGANGGGGNRRRPSPEVEQIRSQLENAPTRSQFNGLIDSLRNGGQIDEGIADDIGYMTRAMYDSLNHADDDDFRFTDEMRNNLLAINELYQGLAAAYPQNVQQKQRTQQNQTENNAPNGAGDANRRFTRMANMNGDPAGLINRIAERAPRSFNGDLRSFIATATGNTVSSLRGDGLRAGISRLLSNLNNHDLTPDMQNATRAALLRMEQVALQSPTGYCANVVAAANRLNSNWRELGQNASNEQQQSSAQGQNNQENRQQNNAPTDDDIRNAVDQICSSFRSANRSEVEGGIRAALAGRMIEPSMMQRAREILGDNNPVIRAIGSWQQSANQNTPSQNPNSTAATPTLDGIPPEVIEANRRNAGIAGLGNTFTGRPMDLLTNMGQDCNCWKCAWTDLLRRRGFDVYARSYDDNPNSGSRYNRPEFIKSQTACSKVYENIGGIDKPDLVNKLNEILRDNENYPDGTAIICWEGHGTLAIKEHGGFTFIDAWSRGGREQHFENGQSLLTGYKEGYLGYACPIYTSSMNQQALNYGQEAEEYFHSHRDVKTRLNEILRKDVSERTAEDNRFLSTPLIFDLNPEDLKQIAFQYTSAKASARRRVNREPSQDEIKREIAANRDNSAYWKMQGTYVIKPSDVLIPEVFKLAKANRRY